jgi:hypothetical protein
MSGRRERLKAAAQEYVTKRKVERSVAEPTYPPDNSMPVEDARQKLDQIIDDFIRVAAEWNAPAREDELNAFEAHVAQLEQEDRFPPPVHASRIPTGVGKTQRFAAGLSRHILACKAAGDTTRSWLYLVPTHRLGEDIADHFRAHGLTAKVYRGRNADDPTIPGYLEQPKHARVKMCRNLERVQLAVACSQDITESCCKNKQCDFYNECGYQHQLRGETPDVWIAAHNMLFHPQKKFGKVAGVVIDETTRKALAESNRTETILHWMTLRPCIGKTSFNEIVVHGATNLLMFCRSIRSEGWNAHGLLTRFSRIGASFTLAWNGLSPIA